MNPLATHVVHGRHISRFERIKCKAEQLSVPDREVMVIWNAGCTSLRIEPLGKGVAQRVDTTTRPGACFKHGDVVTCLCELVPSR